MKQPIIISGRTAKLLSEQAAHVEVLDDDQDYRVLDNSLHKDFTTFSMHSLTFQVIDEADPFKAKFGQAYRFHYPVGGDLIDWDVDFVCEAVRPEVTIVFVPDRGTNADAQ